jgi:hypothetical protein
MITILIALIAVTALSSWIIIKAGYTTYFFPSIVAPIMAFIGFGGLIAYAFLSLNYYGAKHKMNIVNREYGTSYTQEEIFYASGVIDTIRELERKRLELNLGSKHDKK